MINWLNVVFPLVREYFPQRYVTIAGEGLQGLFRPMLGAYMAFPKREVFAASYLL